MSTVPFKAPLLFPCIKEWWAYVIVTPEDNKIIVLSKGNSKGLTDSMPIGGQWVPISTLGDTALWKYAQKIPKKKRASDIIKRATPIFKPLCTARVWDPKYVPSVIISLNQNDIDAIKLSNPTNKPYIANIKPWKLNTAVVVTVNREKLVNIGHGDGDTRWKGWDWNLFIYSVI